MGTVKYAGPVASFHCPTNVEIRSLKVHFSPKQEGSGDPSPENVREIEGWNGVVIHNDDGVVVPDEYQKVEYLESTGTQYIDTNIIPTVFNACKFYIKCALLSKDTTVFYGINNFRLGGSSFQGVSIDYQLRQDASGYAGRYFSYVQYGGVFEQTIDNGMFYCLDQSFRMSVHEQDLNTQHLYLFVQGPNSTNTNRALRVYKFSYNDMNGTAINFVPCRRKLDNKPGMYDTVSGEFFTNQGTGEFICGPDIGETTDYEFGVLGKNKLNPNGDWVVGNPYCYMYIPECKSECILSFTEKDASVDLSGIYLGFGYEEPTSSTNMNKGYRWCIQNGILTSDEKTNTVLTGSQSDFVGQLCNYLVVLPNTSEALNKIFSKYNIQLELGSTATAYEPYDPNHTVYGGWVDLITGEVCEKYYKLTFNGTEVVVSSYTTNEADFIRIMFADYDNPKIKFGLKSSEQNIENSKYSHGVYTIKNTDNTFSHGACVANNGNTNTFAIIHLPKSIYTSDITEDVKTYLAAQYNNDTPVEICYEIAEPIYYNLAPTELQTFLGQNNVWSNADYVEVEYDLHETQSILARKQFIVANQPHIVKPAAAPIQTFTTDVSASLKECKIYFNPVQEGSGDPSLENVRAISGWNGIVASANRAPLPEEYQEVEYIQSTSIYSYFITDYYPNDKTDYYIKIHEGNSNTNNLYPTAFSAGELFELYKKGYYQWKQIKNNSSYESTGLYVYRDLVEMRSKNRTWQIIDVNNQIHNLTIPQYDSFQCDIPLIILAREVDGVIKSNKTGDPYPKLYRLTLYENEETIRDYIPCYRKSDNEVGLYDLINKTFLTHSGEGAFDAGPDITTGSIVYTNWTNEAGTIYGGYVNLITGEIWKTYHKIVADGINVVANSSYMTNDVIAAGIVYLNPIGLSCIGSYILYEGKASNVFTDTIPIYSQAFESKHSGLSLPYATATTAGQQYIIFKIANRADYPEVTDATTCKAFVNAWLQEHPVTIVYELKTPELVTTLTPTQLKTLRGTNNIWSNANGNIELAYWTH